MRRSFAVVIGASLMLAGCSSSGSAASGTPVAERTTAIPSTSTTPSPVPTGVPKVTETFTLLPCPTDPATTLEIEGCAEHRIVRLDRRINALTSELFDMLSDNGKQNVIAAQSAWDAYRHAECQSESDVFEGGTLAGVIAAQCIARLATERVEGLTEMFGNFTSE